MAKKKATKKVPAVMGRPPKYTDKEIEQIADDLNKWSLQDHVLYLKSWVAQTKYDLDTDDIVEFSKKNDYFYRVYKKVKSRLVSRIYEKTSNKELDSAFIRAILPLSDPDYKKWRHEELGREQANSEKQFKLLIDKARTLPSEENNQ